MRTRTRTKFKPVLVDNLASLHQDELIYLGSPYSHVDPVVRMNRAALVSQLAGKFMKCGRIIYCPIAETVFIAQFTELLDTTFNFWRDQDIPKLSRCTDLWVSLIDGWKQSVGLRHEIYYALSHNIPVSFVSLDMVIVPATNFLICEMYNIASIEDLLNV